MGLAICQRPDLLHLGRPGLGDFVWYDLYYFHPFFGSQHELQVDQRSYLVCI